MKKIAIITPVPAMVNSIIENSMLSKADERGVVQYNVIDLREYGIGNYKQIDDTPFGGGSGMVMMAEPLIQAIEVAKKWCESNTEVRIVFPSPQGKTWNHQSAIDFGEHDNFIFICGHYKGIDQRIIDHYVTDEISIGDYVLTSGEIPTMIIIDSIVRLIPGVLNSIESATSDSFFGELLDNPHYTKPRVVNEMNVPEVLLNGNHQEISNWRQNLKEKVTKSKRPDIWRSYIKKSKVVE